MAKGFRSSKRMCIRMSERSEERSNSQGPCESADLGCVPMHSFRLPCKQVVVLFVLAPCPSLEAMSNNIRDHSVGIVPMEVSDQVRPYCHASAFRPNSARFCSISMFWLLQLTYLLNTCNQMADSTSHTCLLVRLHYWPTGSSDSIR